MGAVVVVVVTVVVHGHFLTSRCSGSILQRFGLELFICASRVAKILCFGSVLQLSRVVLWQ